jgi:hypothetical protein
LPRHACSKLVAPDVTNAHSSVTKRCKRPIGQVRPFERIGDVEHRAISPVAAMRRAMMTDAIKPTTTTKKPNLSTEHQNDGDARRPSDTLNKDTPSTEGQNAPKRKSSLT